MNFKLFVYVSKDMTPKIIIRRDNQNIYQHDKNFSKELNKLRFKKPQLERYSDFLLVMSQLQVNPYETSDFNMDVEKFIGGIEKVDREIFCLYFTEGWTQEEVAEELGYSQQRISQRLEVLAQLWKEFYYGDE